MKLIPLLLLISAFNFNQVTAQEIKYKTTKEDFLQQLTDIWNSSEINIKVEEYEFNSIKKDYLIITVTSAHSISEEEFSTLASTTSSHVFKNIANTKDFKVARVDYINTTSETKKSETLYQIIDKPPVLKGCKKNASNAALKKCFNQKLMTHIQKNFKLSKFENLGLEKKKHKANAVFTIGEKGTIINIVVEHENSVVRDEVEKLMKSLKVKKPGFNNGKPVAVTYTFPIMFMIE